MRLKQDQIDGLTKPGRYGDGLNGLHFFVRKSGHRSWVQRIMRDGKRRDVGLGGYPALSLDDARRAAAANVNGRSKPKRKTHRASVKAARPAPTAPPSGNVPTVREAVNAHFDRVKFELKGGEANRTAWIGPLEKHAFPSIGDKTVDTVTQAEVIDLLLPLYQRVPTVYKTVRSRLRRMFAYYVARQDLQSNPAGENIDGAFDNGTKKKSRNHPALPYGLVGAFLSSVQKADCDAAGKLAFRFLVLTCARSAEVRGAKWEEIDLAAKTWTIPAERMKAGVEHRVPLSDPALDVLHRVRDLPYPPSPSGHIFVSLIAPGKHISEALFRHLLSRMGLKGRATAHGFRSSFRDWAAENGVEREVAEAVLAHRVYGVEGAYFRSDLYGRRREVMEAWADYITSEGETA